MATQLTIVNNVLNELREDTVSSVADTAYSKLIAIFLNRAKEWMEDVNHMWSHYYTVDTVTISANGASTDFPSSNTNHRSILLRDQQDDKIPAAYDITDGEHAQLYDIPYSDARRERVLVNDDNKTVTAPRTFAIGPTIDGQARNVVVVFPVDSAESDRTWQLHWYVPQDRLAIDGTDDSTSIRLPSPTLELRTLYLAANERGEEMGQPGGIMWEAANTSLASALERDQWIMRSGQSGDARDWSNNECL